MNTTATPTNSTTTTATQNGQTVHTVTINPAPAAAPKRSAKALLNKPKATAPEGTKPMTPKALFTELDKPGTITKFIDAALDSNDLEPLVIMASHVNRSECLKAAHAAIKFSDYAYKYAAAYDLTGPEFTRLLAKLVIKGFDPANLEDEAAEAPATATAQDTTPAQTLTQTTPPTPTATSPETISPAPAEKPGETANIFGIQDAPPAPAKTKKGTHKA